MNHRIYRIVFIVLLIVISFLNHTCLLSQSFRSGDTIHAHIDVDSAFTIIDLNANNPAFILLDVRTPGEYDVYHLWNGVLLDYNSSGFDSMLNTLDKNKIYLIYCASGGRSANAFNLMKTKEFKFIYNMLGGISAWNLAGYPTTDLIKPVFMPVSDTLLQFDSTIIGSADTIPVTLTNFGNGLLILNGLTGISGSDFETDFIPGTNLSGLYDYSFHIIYKPSDQIPDSIVIKVTSNGGDQDFVLKGSDKTSSFEETDHSQNSIFPNPASGVFYVKGKNIQQLEVYSLNGRKMLLKKMDFGSGNVNKIDLSNLAKGSYIIVIKGDIHDDIYTIILN